MSISGHKMTLFKIDGGNAVDTTPSAEAIGVLYPGERMDVIVEPVDSEEAKNSMLTIKLDREYVSFRPAKIHVLTVIQEFDVQKLCINPHPAFPHILVWQAARAAIAS